MFFIFSYRTGWRKEIVHNKAVTTLSSEGVMVRFYLTPELLDWGSNRTCSVGLDQKTKGENRGESNISREPAP